MDVIVQVLDCIMWIVPQPTVVDCIVRVMFQVCRWKTGGRHTSGGGFAEG